MGSCARRAHTPTLAPPTVVNRRGVAAFGTGCAGTRGFGRGLKFALRLARTRPSGMARPYKRGGIGGPRRGACSAAAPDFCSFAPTLPRTSRCDTRKRAGSSCARGSRDPTRPPRPRRRTTPSRRSEEFPMTARQKSPTAMQRQPTLHLRKLQMASPPSHRGRRCRDDDQATTDDALERANACAALRFANNQIRAVDHSCVVVVDAVDAVEASPPSPELRCGCRPHVVLSWRCRANNDARRSAVADFLYVPVSGDAAAALTNFYAE